MKKTKYYLPLIYSFLASSIIFNCQSKDTISKKKPNILFCIADDATWKHMSAYGTDWIKTPAFDRIADQGLLFNNAYTPNAKCGPSRSIILTGRNTWQLEEAANHLAYFPTKFKTYPEALSEKGYHVGYTGKGWAPGTSLNEDGSKRELIVKAYNKMKTEPPTKGISHVDYAQNFKSFLDKKKSDQPFCFWYGGHEPHRKYEYGSGVRIGNKKLSELDSVFPYWPQSDIVKNDVLDYAFELEYFDKQLEEMLKILQERNELENTLIIVTSDNGMPFPRVKGLSYEHSNHLPLAVMWKKGIKNPGRKINDYVSFIDFAATFLDLTGYDTNDLGMQPIQGKSLKPFFDSNEEDLIEDDKDYVLLGQERHDVGRPNDVGYPIRGIVKNGFLYLLNYKPERWPAGNPETGYTNTDGSPTKTEILELRRNNLETKYWNLNFGKHPKEELYNLRTDENCLDNLAENKEFQPIKENLKSILESDLKTQKDPRIIGNDSIFDNYPPDRNKHFYERYMKGENVKAGWINKSDFEAKE
ncbi:sulfatase family protein [Gaetbulibacter saemankumensis]|uniref:sulfatase family protein n=1 Tax=Gaetbulibacter saemankumensis TaxID=311208 RepID=UPI00041417FB|nr:sulfatase [Gaetbulibacter saemankumensis]